MGSTAYWYFTNYEPDANSALQKLRDREFKAGRYNPVVHFPEFPVTAKTPSPGPRHASIDAAMMAAAENGTRSILDIQEVADQPDFCVAALLDDEVLEEFFQTTQPTREMVEANMDFLEDVERGFAVYFVVYKNNKPAEYYFAGYSFD